MKKVFGISVLVASLFASCTSEKVQPLPFGCVAEVSYATDIKPIIDAQCNGCHSPGGTGTGDFTVFSELKGKVDNGSFKNRVFTLKDMPPAGGTVLSAEELTKLNCWLGQGAPNN